LVFLSALSGQGSPLFWAAVHMGSHHPSYDSEKDIHSPIHGKFHSFLSWYWKMDPKKVSFVTVREYFPDKTLMFIHKNHNIILMSYWLFLSLWGVDELVYFGLLPSALSMTLVGLVNSLLHSDGSLSRWLLLKYKTYDDPTTFNSVPLGMLTMGLGLHNNHHHNQSQAVYSEKWFEIDFSRWIIPIFAKSPLTSEKSDLTSANQK
jgi:stearoyl-CoA desaturase (delta-9 desaturase)